MQHKLSDSWKNVYDTEYLTMAEDGIEDVPCRRLPSSINSNNADSIVSNLLRKASGIRDEISMGRMTGGLEQKIQELRVEKETLEFSKCPSPTHNAQDSPIDFSVKRRTSFSGSLTDDSQTSSSSPGHMTDYNTMSPSTDLGSVHDNIKRDTLTPDGLDDQRFHGQIDAGVSHVSLPPLLSRMGLFPGVSSTLMTNGSGMNTFSQIAAAALKDPRNKNSRPFKVYPKEALQMPLGFFGIPGLASSAIQHGVDLGMFMGVNNEELLHLYHQQLQLVRDNKLLDQGITDSTSPQLLSSSNGKHSHHHYQHQHYHHNPSPPTTTISSLSPPLAKSDHHKTTTTSNSSFHTPSTSASLNAALVSSTSSFALSNSRKRPRSLPDDRKDAAYWERRRKNNDAAKRSRDARRAKEDEIALRAALLEQENLKLRVEVAALKSETERLRCMLYSN